MNMLFASKAMIGTLIKIAVLLMLPFCSAVAEERSASPSAGAMFAEGVAWEQFLAATRIQRETWQANAARPVSPDLAERFRRAGDGLKLLVITAEWCPDSAHSVPYIASLAAAAGVELRVLDSKAGKPVMNANRTPDGRASTPTVVLLREDRQAAAWVEQPAPMQWWSLDVADEISKDEMLERKMSWYDWDRGKVALTEIVLLAEQTANKN